MRVFAAGLIAIAVVAGCGLGGHAGSKEAEKFFVEWLEGHGEENVTVTPEGVGIEGNATRLRASLYGSDKSENGYVVETEFRILLPSGDEIIEYVAGDGDTEEQASDWCFANFMFTTFHPIYKSFINPADPHQTVEEITVGGARREMVMGDIFVRQAEGSAEIDTEALRPQIRAAIAEQSLSESPHWIKIVYGHVANEPIIVAATLDNGEHPKLPSAIQNLPWPQTDDFYMVKQFIVIK